MTHKKSLARLQLVGNISKLTLFNEAVEQYGKRDTIEAFKTKSYREFAQWVKPSAPRASGLPDVELAIRDGHIEIDGVDMLEVDDELPDAERDFIAKTLKAAYRARRGQCIAHIVAVYDDGEARAVDNFLKKLRAQK